MPNDNEQDNVIRFPDREPPIDPKTEQIEAALVRLETGDPVEEHFYTPGGNAGMRRLMRMMNDGQDLVRTTQGMLAKSRPEWDDTTELLLSEQGRYGLRHPTLIQPFLVNPAMHITHEMIARAKHAGAQDMEFVYKVLHILLADITRFELSKGQYDPEADRWLSWSGKIPYHTGDPNKIDYYHPHRLKPRRT